MKAGALIELLRGLDPETLVAIPCDSGVDPRGQMIFDVLRLESAAGRGPVVKLVGLLDIDLLADDHRSLARNADQQAGVPR